MSAAAAPVWVVASSGTATRWSEALSRAGLAAVPLPWSEAVAPADPGALAAALDLPSDLVLLTSGNALRWLPPGAARGRPAACVGPGTAAAARAAGFEVRLVGEAGGEALAARIGEEMPEVRDVLFLRGADAREEAVEALRRAGRRVRVAVAYGTRPRPAFLSEVRGAPAPGALLVGSPRAAEALTDALRAAGRPEAREAPAVAAGETTAARLREVGFRRVVVAARPEPEALVAALGDLR